MAAFLRFVVERSLEGRQAELKESLIGVHVFDRVPGYDTKSDAIVRVEARRLRSRLDEYYQGVGAGDALKIALPKGGYVPEFSEAAPPEPAAEPPTVAAVAVAAPRLPWIPVAAGLALAVVIAGWYFTRPVRTPVAAAPRPFTWLPGVEANPAFSPDGESIAFAGVGVQGNMDLFIQRVGSDQATAVTTTPEDENGAAWSPDGKQLAFFRKRGDGRMSLITRRLDNGAEVILGDVVEGAGTLARLDWSPNGEFLVAADQDERQVSRIVRFSVRTRQRDWLTAPPEGAQGDSCPAISPNGAVIAFRRAMTSEVESIYLMRLGANGTAIGETRLTNESWGHRGHDWTPDGRALVASLQKEGTLRSLWIVPIDGSPMRRLMPSSLLSVQPAVSRRGKRLAWVTSLDDMNLWAAPAEAGAKPKMRIGSTYFDMAPQYSPDGERIVFRSNRSGISAIWIASRSGTVERKLVDFNGAQVSAARWSPDGQRIIFESRVSGSSDLYWIDAVHPAAKPVPFLTGPKQEVLPWWSADGKWIYYSSDQTGGWQIWKAPFDGKTAPVQLTTQGAFAPVESADGRYLYYVRDAKAGGLYRAEIRGATLGAEESVLPSLAGPLWGNWGLSSDAVYFFDLLPDTASQTRAVMKKLNLQTRVATELFAIDRLPARWDTGLAISPDGRELLFAQLDRTGSDIFLLENFTP